MNSDPLLNNTSDELLALKSRLKALQGEKRRLSKQVGQAKKTGLPCNDLIAGVGQLSDQIKSLKAKLNELNNCSPLDSSQTSTSDRPSISPPQFSSKRAREAVASRFVLLNEERSLLWERYIQQHPRSTAYHSLNTMAVIRESFNHQELYLMALDDQDRPCGVLPIIRQKSRLFGDNWCSVPLFNYGGALGENETIEEQLMREAADRVSKQGGNHIEFRDSQARHDMPCKTEKVSMLLNLPTSTAQLWQGIGTKVRAQIKKAKSFDLHVRTGREELVDDFYAVFARNMRDLGTPVYDKQFFINMLKHHPTAHITIAFQASTPIAAGFTLGWRNTLEIPWASTLRAANKLNANMLLYWKILSFAIQSGYQVFDFGRSSKDASTYKFKKQWGAQPHQLYWHYWLSNGAEIPQTNPNNPKYKLLIATWQRLPTPLTRIIGPPIARYLP